MVVVVDIDTGTRLAGATGISLFASFSCSSLSFVRSFATLTSSLSRMESHECLVNSKKKKVRKIKQKYELAKVNK